MIVPVIVVQVRVIIPPIPVKGIAVLLGVIVSELLRPLRIYLIAQARPFIGRMTTNGVYTSH